MSLVVVAVIGLALAYLHLSFTGASAPKAAAAPELPPRPSRQPRRRDPLPSLPSD